MNHPSPSSGRPGPARPGRPKSQAKRDAISQAAGELFLREGYARTSMEAVAAEARVSKQTVYSHFENKDALFCACIDQKCREYQLAVAGGKAEPAGLRGWLVDTGDRFLRLIADRKVIAMWRLLINEADEHPQIVELFWQAGPRKTADAIAAALARLGGESLAIDDPAEAAQVFLGLLRTDYHNRLMFDLSPPYDDSARRAQAEKATEQLLKLYGR